MTFTFTKLRERMGLIHRLLVTHPKESGLNHFERQQLEEEYEELEAKETERRVFGGSDTTD